MIKYQTIDIYGITVVFLVEPTKVEFELMYHDNVERIDDDEYKQMYKDIFENEKCGGFTTLLNKGSFVCCVKEALNHNYIAHEIGHLAIRVLWSRGIEIKDDNDEPFTYLVGWLTGLYYEWIVAEKIAKIERLK